MCMLLYVKLLWCSDVTYIYGQLQGGGWWSVCIGICVIFYMCILFDVVVFQRSMVNWMRGWDISALLSVHTSICETWSV